MVRHASALLAVLSLLLAACSSDDAGPEADALAACLARPGQLPRPPASTLPCELIPPGLSLK